MIITHESPARDIINWFYNRADYKNGKRSNIEFALSNDQDKLLVAIYTRKLPTKNRWVLRYNLLDVDAKGINAIWQERWETYETGLTQKAKVWVTKPVFDEIPSEYKDDKDSTVTEAILSIYEQFGAVVHSDTIMQYRKGTKKLAQGSEDIKKLWKELSLSNKEELLEHLKKSYRGSLARLIKTAPPKHIVEFLEKQMLNARYNINYGMIDKANEKHVATLALAGFRPCTYNTLNVKGDYEYEADLFYDLTEFSKDELVTLGFDNRTFNKFSKKAPECLTIRPTTYPTADRFVEWDDLLIVCGNNFSKHKASIVDYLEDKNNYQPYWIKNGELDFISIAADISIHYNILVNPLGLEYLNKVMGEKAPSLLGESKPCQLILDTLAKTTHQP